MATKKGNQEDRIGRDAKTGQYIPLEEALSRPDDTVTEPRHQPKPPKKGR